METYDYKLFILDQLKERNTREHSFSELIVHSNRLLESLDYLQKENISLKVLSNKFEQDSASSSESMASKSEDINMLKKCCALQKELADSHKKISDYAQQVIEFKNVLDEKNKLLDAQKSQLSQVESALIVCQERCKNDAKQIAILKTALQNKTDECDTLNITYSSLESKKNDLEVENKKLKKEFFLLKSKDSGPLSEEIHERVTRTDSAIQNQSKKTPEYVRTSSLNQIQDLHIRSTDSEPASSNSDDVLSEKVKFYAHNSEVNAVMWVMSSSQLITAGSDRRVKLWEILENDITLKKCVRDCNSSVMSIDLDEEANLLLCASCDFASRLWIVSDLNLRHTLTGHSGKVMSAKFVLRENFVVTGSTDQTLKLWDLRSRVCIKTCAANCSVNDVISKGGNLVMSGHADKKIRAWDIRTNSIVSHIPSTSGVTSLDVSNNGFSLLASQLDNKLVLYDIRKNQEIRSMTANGFQVGFDWTRAKFSPDNQYCSCGSKNGSVFLWNVSSGVVKKELKAHDSAVTSCSWSSCNSYLASCDSNRKCIIWSK